MPDKKNLTHGFCDLCLVPVRKEPAHSSEMVTQLLFGDIFSIHQTDNNWIKIQNAADGYAGWIHQKQFLAISKKTFNTLKQNNFSVVSEMQSAIENKRDGIVFPIVLGSRIPETRGGKFTVEDMDFVFHGKKRNTSLKTSRKNIVEIALQFLNAPYLWGGKSEFGIDCSGFTQVVYGVNGKELPRDAYQQEEIGKELDFVEQALPGDLAFFDNEQGKIIHVGIVLDEQRIIHASGRVRIDILDATGIRPENSNTYSHQLRSIKRIF